jgi:hypothetical protein
MCINRKEWLVGHAGQKSNSKCQLTSTKRKLKMKIFMIVLIETLCISMALAWTVPESIGTNVNTPENSEFTPRVSKNMLTLFLSSWERPGGYGGLDIWVSTRATINDPWGVPTNAGPGVNTEYNDYFGAPSANMLGLYFTSDRPGGYNDEDIYVSTRLSHLDGWGEPSNLGPQVNAAAWNCQPAFTHNMLLMYLSAEGPNGDSEILVSTRNSVYDLWGPVVSIGSPVNTEYEDTNPSLSPDGLTLYFDSDRPGSPGVGGIWQTTRESIDAPWLEPVALPLCINANDVFTPWILNDGKTLMFGMEVDGNRDIYQSVPEPTTVLLLSLGGLLLRRRK